MKRLTLANGLLLMLAAMPIEVLAYTTPQLRSSDEIQLSEIQNPCSYEYYYDYDGNGTMDFRFTKGNYRDKGYIISLDENYNNYILAPVDIAGPGTLRYDNYWNGGAPVKGCLFNDDEYPDFNVPNTSVFVSNGYQFEEKIMASRNNMLYEAFMDYNNDGRPEFFFNSSIFSFNHDGSIVCLPWINGTPQDFTNERGVPSCGLHAQDINQALFFDMFGNGWGNSEPTFGPFDYWTLDFSSVDLNGDGFMDLLDSNYGMAYINDGHGAWIRQYLGGKVLVRDFNNDNVMDYVVYDKNNQKITLYAAQPDKGELKQQILATGLLFGQNIWTYDFDNDGDVDLLVPVEWDNSGYFLLLIENKGNLTFKKHEFFIEESNGFVACIDIDADGCLELLSVSDYDESNSFNYYSLDSYKITRQNTIETTPKRLVTKSIRWDGYKDRFHIGDFRNDGTMRIVSREDNAEYIALSPNKNQRPKAPGKPTYTYDAASGLLKLNWQRGSDAESSSVDLTYEIRVGTAPGKCDVMPVMSLADGTRRCFREGNNGHSTQRILDVSSWPGGKLYISVQSIDPNLKGSEFSEYAVFEKGPAADFFVIQNECVSTNEVFTLSLRSPANQTYSYNWNVDGARIVEESADHSSVKISYEKEGKKDISLAVTDADGNISLVKKTLTVLPGLSFNEKINGPEDMADVNFLAIDIDCDGISELFCKSSMLKSDNSGNYDKIKKLWNTNLNVNAVPKTADINNDGNGDIDIGTAFLINEDDLDMSCQSYETNRKINGTWVDFDNDGCLDVLSISTQAPIYIYPNSGDYINYGDKIDLGQLFNSNNYTEDILLRDFDGNGYIDIAYIQTNSFFIKREYGIIYNHGDFNFTVSMFTPRTTDGYIIDFYDLDNDNKIDLLVQYEKDGQYYYKIEWGNGRETELKDLYDISSPLTVVDIDNNGYSDIVVAAKGKSDTKEKAYIVMTYKPDIVEIFEFTGDCFSGNSDLFYDGRNNPRTRLCYSEENRFGLFTGQNEKPKAPTGIRCAQNSKGVLVEWDHSIDRETPAQAMRYNLSVKRKGAEGDGSYLISPMNCGKNGVHIPSDMILISSNRYFIPIDKIVPGEYEVMVQGVDLWRMESDFSTIYNLTVTESVDIDLPPSTYAGKETKISVAANVTAQIDWDGAEVTNEGKEYNVTWNTPGTKTIVVGKKKYEILVKAMPAINCDMPSLVQAQAKVVIKGENLDNAKITTYPDHSSISSYDEDMALIFNKAGEYVVTIQAEIDGLLIEKEYNVTATEPSAPEIAMVGIDGKDGKYCINMAGVKAPADASALIVYKETQRQGEYRKLATLDPNSTKFIDEESHPTICAEKYKLAWQLSYGESRASVEHKPLHVMVNKGVGTSWNLIWNKYEGLEVATYRILRGSSIDNLKAIAEVSGSMASYCDTEAPAGELYYAVEVLEASAPQRAQARSGGGYSASRSNVISTKDANEVVFVENIELRSTTGSNKIDASSNADLQLVAFLTPSTVTYRQLNWMVIGGNDIVSVDQKGLVTAKQNGEATIRAYALDGSEIYADFDLVVSGMPVRITSLTLDHTELSLMEGSSEFLHGTILPKEASNQELVWSSSNEKVATVSSGGEVRAQSTGQAVITAATQDGSDLTAQCVVKVTPKYIYAERIVFEHSEIDLKIGAETTLKCTVYPEDTTDKTLTWSSSDDSIVTVDGKGLVKAVAVGQAVITVRCGDVSAECKVRVTPVEVESVTLSHDTVTLQIGGTQTVSATVRPDNATDKNLTWTVDDPNVAAIEASGSKCEITGLSAGTTAVIVKAGNGISATMTVTVDPTKAESVTLNQESVTLTIGDSYQLVAEVNPSNTTDKTLTWSSSDESVATVDRNGLVKAVAVGQAVITVRCGDVSAECKVRVTPVEVESVTLSHDTVTLQIGGTQTVSATIRPDNATDQSLTWAVDDPGVASIVATGSKCEITGVSAGRTTLTVKGGNGISATMTVTVDPTKAESVTLSQESVTLTLGDSYQLVAEVNPSNTTDKTLTWSSSDESVATVDRNGLVQAVAVGQAVITVRCGDVSAECKVRVTPVEVESVTLSHDTVTLQIGGTQTVSATIRPDNATDQSLTWAVDDPGVASIVATGSKCEITGVSAGRTTLTVKAGNGVAATMTVTVDPTKVESVTLNQESVTLTIGDLYQLVAEISPDNTTDKTLTWSSSEESVATVDRNGLVKAVGVGQAVITVRCGDVSAECKVQVMAVLAEDIKLDTHKLTLTVGDTYQFGYAIWPENTTFKDVEWRSSDNSIAEVTQNGFVTINHEGEAVITVMVLDGSGVCDSCVINAESGISDTSADNHTIHVEGNTIFNDYGFIAVYTGQGTLVYAGDKDRITLEIKGVYLISTPDFTTKIVIR